jgi:hypothetical protein
MQKIIRRLASSAPARQTVLARPPRQNWIIAAFAGNIEVRRTEMLCILRQRSGEPSPEYNFKITSAELNSIRVPELGCVRHND